MRIEIIDRPAKGKTTTAYKIAALLLPEHRNVYQYIPEKWMDNSGIESYLPGFITLICDINKCTKNDLLIFDEHTEIQNNAKTVIVVKTGERKREYFSTS